VGLAVVVIPPSLVCHTDLHLSVNSNNSDQTRVSRPRQIYGNDGWGRAEAIFEAPPAVMCSLLMPGQLLVLHSVLAPNRSVDNYSSSLMWFYYY